jgi:hypothetical protein
MGWLPLSIFGDQQRVLGSRRPDTLNTGCGLAAARRTSNLK